VLDAGGRGATTTFTQREIGDVLVTFENEVNLVRAEFGDKFDVVYPATSILAESPVAVVDKVVDRRNLRKQATGYLNFLYSEEGAGNHRQALAAPALGKSLQEIQRQLPPDQPVHGG
jgi:sulfate transport system substrate-binding protein